VNLQPLREKLEQGFYVDNLYEMARLCKGMALESKNSVPFFIMQKIFSGIADYWDEKPVIVEEAKLVQVELVKSLKSLIDAIEDNASAEKTMNLMDKAVSSYLFLYR
jgi:hypothetical protein